MKRKSWTGCFDPRVDEPRCGSTYGASARRDARRGAPGSPPCPQSPRSTSAPCNSAEHHRGPQVDLRLVELGRRPGRRRPATPGAGRSGSGRPSGSPPPRAWSRAGTRRSGRSSTGRPRAGRPGGGPVRPGCAPRRVTDCQAPPGTVIGRSVHSANTDAGELAAVQGRGEEVAPPEVAPHERRRPMDRGVEAAVVEGAVLERRPVGGHLGHVDVGEDAVHEGDGPDVPRRTSPSSRICSPSAPHSSSSPCPTPVVPCPGSRPEQPCGFRHRSTAAR